MKRLALFEKSSGNSVGNNRKAKAEQLVKEM